MPLLSSSDLVANSESPSEQVSETTSENIPNYSELDHFTAETSKTGGTSETASENNSENSQGMSEADCIMVASGGVSKFEWLAGAYVGAEVVIPDKQKEEIATKAAVVIKKHFGDAELPPWLVQWKEEISLGLALGTCVISIYQQKKVVDAELEKQNKENKTSDHPNYDLKMGAV